MISIKAHFHRSDNHICIIFMHDFASVESVQLTCNAINNKKYKNLIYMKNYRIVNNYRISILIIIFNKIKYL